MVSRASHLLVPCSSGCAPHCRLPATALRMKSHVLSGALGQDRRSQDPGSPVPTFASVPSPTCQAPIAAVISARGTLTHSLGKLHSGHHRAPCDSPCPGSS